MVIYVPLMAIKVPLMAIKGLKKTAICSNYRQIALFLPITEISSFFFLYKVSNTIRVIRVENFELRNFLFWFRIPAF